jgi:hypothetical protein
MGTMLIRRPCWFCKYTAFEIEALMTCKYCKGNGSIQFWLSQEVGELLVRVDPEWYEVMDRCDDDSSV